MNQDKLIKYPNMAIFRSIKRLPNQECLSNNKTGLGKMVGLSVFVTLAHNHTVKQSSREGIPLWLRAISSIYFSCLYDSSQL